MIPDWLRHRGTDSRFPRWQWVLCRAWMQFWMRRRDVSSSQPRGDSSSRELQFCSRGCGTAPPACSGRLPASPRADFENVRYGRLRKSALLHFQQRAVATEACAEGGHPPKAARRIATKSGVQDEEDEGAAQVSAIAQHRGAPAQVLLGEREHFTQVHEYVAPASVHDPRGDLPAGRAVLRHHI